MNGRLPLVAAAPSRADAPRTPPSGPEDFFAPAEPPSDCCTPATAPVVVEVEPVVVDVGVVVDVVLVDVELVLVDVEAVVVDVEAVVVDVEPVVVEVDPVVVVVEPVVVVLVVGVVVVVVLVVPPLTHMLASLRWSPGNDGPRRMSPSCFEWPLIQPLMLIEMTTYAFVAEPVLWQTSTFLPFVFSLPEFPAVPEAEPEDGLPFDFDFGATVAETTAGAGELGFDTGAGAGCDGFDFAFWEEAAGFAAGLAAGFDFCFAPLLWPGAFAELPGDELCC